MVQVDKIESVHSHLDDQQEDHHPRGLQPTREQDWTLLETLGVTTNAIIIAPHTDWGYKKTKPVWKIEAEFIYSNAVLLEEQDFENLSTFLSNSRTHIKAGLSNRHVSIAAAI